METPRDPERGRGGVDERQARQIALIGGAVLVVALVLVFVVENTRRVRVSFVFFSADVSLIWVIVLSALAGVAAGLLICRAVRRRFGRGG